MSRASRETYRQHATTADWLVKIATIIIMVVLGSSVWVVNASFSVMGLEGLLGLFGAWGEALRAILWKGTVWGFPALPVAFCAAVTVFEIALGCGYFRSKKISTFVAVSLGMFDLTTTAFGIRMLEWGAEMEWVVIVVISVIVTFSFEFIVTSTIKNALGRD